MANNSISQKRALLKLVHPGRITETYDNPITAAEIMNKYPRHCVTRPDVFKYPWVVVQSESVLQPGDVFYVVPCHTIRWLLRSKECPKQPIHLKEAARPGLDKRTNVKSSDKARFKHWEREKIDCLGGLFSKDEIESCSYEKSSVEAPHLVQSVRSSVNCHKSMENQKLGEFGLGYLRSVYKSGHDYGVVSPNKQFPQQFISKTVSGTMGSRGHRDEHKFPDGQYQGQVRHCNSALWSEDPYDFSAEITRIHQLLRGLSLNRESCSQCQADREDTQLKTDGAMSSRKHSPDQITEVRSTADFTFQLTDKGPEEIEESSPNLTSFRCLPK